MPSLEAPSGNAHASTTPFALYIPLTSPPSLVFTLCSHALTTTLKLAISELDRRREHARELCGALL